MDVLAGARDERHLDDRRRLLAGASLVRITPVDYDEAAALDRSCRRRGGSVRKLIDCLIAATAIRVGAPILHADADFATLARHTPLTTHAASLS